MPSASYYKQKFLLTQMKGQWPISL